jgi:hypothetical protein
MLDYTYACPISPERLVACGETIEVMATQKRLNGFVYNNMPSGTLLKMKAGFKKAKSTRRLVVY